MYGYHAQPTVYHAPHYEQQTAQPLYAQTTNEYFGPAKVLNWTKTEREILDRTLPSEAERDLASVRRARDVYAGMTEYEREDWDTDLWGQQLLRYDLDDQRDRLERELTYAQDKVRAELDEVWEFYKKEDSYQYDRSPAPAKKDYGYGYGYAETDEGTLEDLYDNYDRCDVRETMLRANQLWDGDVLAFRQGWRELNEAEREAHRGAVAEIVARREAEIAGLKQAVIERRIVKRGEVDAANAQLDDAIRTLIAVANAEVETLNDTHQELVLDVLEAVDYFGEEADLKLILSEAGEGSVDLYGEQDVHALYQEDKVAEWKPTEEVQYGYDQRRSYGRPAYGQRYGH
jgi:hypothetical protein